MEAMAAPPPRDASAPQTHRVRGQVRDTYMLKIFEDNQTRMPSWCNNEADMLPFYQILGEYKNKMLLPKFNTIEPYSNMNENFPSLPPTYTRPLGC
ncbi:hypothetical protein GUJ93_ZPchr0002g23870 [Zizania palustris]|uniref:Uncharacterized protein n=1 Tax=Zizania palustris TaxID=103762 RepID=A0A8J5SPC1_ZIZPA|nr:hypothetical protein GUJ93_ZPchr0002g23870 [Zizania palustris]